MDVGIAIPTYERIDLPLRATARVLADPRVRGVTIVDDGSGLNVQRTLGERAAKQPKTRLVCFSGNYGCYLNKCRAVMEARHDEWVILFDSDNELDVDYLDALDGCCPWDPDTLYLPSFAKPVHDYRAYAGMDFTKDTIAPWADRARFFTALNTGNFFVHRMTFLDVFDSFANPMASDSIYIVYRWLASGRRIFFVPGMHYQHRVHNGNYVQYAEQTKEFNADLEQKFRTGTWI